MSLLTDSGTNKSIFYKAFNDAMKARANAQGGMLGKPIDIPTSTSQFISTYKSHEEIFCDTHFGGMKLNDVIAIVKSHSPEYFV